MGGISNQSYDEVRNFNTNITQASTQSCTIVCSAVFSNNTVILINHKGSFNVIQTCDIVDSNCQLKAAFNANITSLIESTVQQSATAMGGISFTFNDQDQSIDISSTINNSISQIMSSTCKIANTSDISNNYIVAIGGSGDINFEQKNKITSTNCYMDSSAKASAFNKSVSDASQATELQNAFTMILVAFIVVIVVIGAVLMAFVLTGGASQAIAAGADFAKDNPQVFL